LVWTGTRQRSPAPELSTGRARFGRSGESGRPFEVAERLENWTRGGRQGGSKCRRWVKTDGLWKGRSVWRSLAKRNQDDHSIFRSQTVSCAPRRPPRSSLATRHSPSAVVSAIVPLLFDGKEDRCISQMTITSPLVLRSPNFFVFRNPKISFPSNNRHVYNANFPLTSSFLFTRIHRLARGIQHCMSEWTYQHRPSWSWQHLSKGGKKVGERQYEGRSRVE